MPARVAPGDRYVFKRKVQHLARRSGCVEDGVRAQIANARLNVHLAVWLDNKQSIVAETTTYVRTHGHTDPRYLRAVTLAASLLSLFPVEKLAA